MLHKIINKFVIFFGEKNIKKILNNIRDFLNYFELSMRKSNGKKIQVKESNRESV